jgi:uncharacterized ubiquitin-like protein YukD
MELILEQQKVALGLLEDFINSGENAFRVELNKEIPYSDLDNSRTELIKTIQVELDKLFSGDTKLEDFKIQIDSINKRNRLWGFKGMNGQMFFNMLFNVASDHGLLDSLNQHLISSLRIPNDIEEAKEKIKKFISFITDMNKLVHSKREAPKIKSSLYFLSYFWQIQSNEKFPIFYNSLEITFEQLGLLSEDEDLANYYENFFELNKHLKILFEKKLNRSVNFWYVEHVFWHYFNTKINVVIEKSESRPLEKEPLSSIAATSDEYVPSILADIPLIAISDSKIEEKYPGQKLDLVFEEKMYILFKMLGYEVEKLGPGKRDVDGIAKAKKDHYAIVYDCKCRHDGFGFHADDERTVIEYIQKNKKRLNNEGMDRIYFAIISSSFDKISDKQLKDILRQSGANNIPLIRAEQLLNVLKLKLIDPSIDLEKLEDVFQTDGTIEDIQEMIV